MTPGREFEELLVSKLGSSEHRPTLERHNISGSNIKSLVGMKAGISLVLESDFGAVLPGLPYRELRDGNGSSRLGYNAYWRADNENLAVESFLSLLSERYPSLK